MVLHDLCDAVHVLQCDAHHDELDALRRLRERAQQKQEVAELAHALEELEDPDDVCVQPRLSLGRRACFVVPVHVAPAVGGVPVHQRDA